MATSGNPPAAPARRRLRKRIVIPAILLLLVLVLFIGLYIRGTSASDKEHNPGSSAEGSVTWLYRAPDGNVYVRCALVIDATPKEVWAVVTDYNHQSSFLPYVSQMSSEKEKGEQVHVMGVAHSRIWGDWPFDTLVSLHEQPDRGEYTVSWDDEGKGDFAINRGSWEMRPAGEGKTLLVYSLQVELRRYPPFIVRNVIMDRIHSIVGAVRDEVQRRRPAKG